MQERSLQDMADYTPKILPARFQPIIPIPTKPQPRCVEEGREEYSRHSFVLVSENNSTEQLEMYKRQCRRLTAENLQLQNTLSCMYREKAEIQNHIHGVNNEKSDTEDKKKRFRRVASQISRIYICPDDKCGKSYGTDASLVQHIKIKHHEYYQTQQFQNFIQKIRSKGNSVPKNRQPLVGMSMLNVLNNL